MTKIIEYLENIKGESTAHLSGFKKVFLEFFDTETDLTQFAYGELKSGEVVEEHVHPTMEEFFFFLKGSGFYNIDGRVHHVKQSTFIRIPSNVKHSLEAKGSESLCFIYFGVGI
ncbi:MAG: mannose-6-phosphate isomerase-like protein (cupin superfamily) [Cyclobacteriaceae bacterium]